MVTLLFPYFLGKSVFGKSCFTILQEKKPRTPYQCPGQYTFLVITSLIFSHPDYTVGTGFSPIQLQCRSRTHCKSNITVGRESMNSHITLPRRFLFTSISICIQFVSVNSYFGCTFSSMNHFGCPSSTSICSHFLMNPDSAEFSWLTGFSSWRGLHSSPAHQQYHQH